MARVVIFNPDHADYVGDTDDGVYYQVEEGRSGRFVTCAYCGRTFIAANGACTYCGTVPTEEVALGVGYHSAAAWCYANHVHTDGV